MDDRKIFYVRFPTQPTEYSIATGIQVIIPEGLNYFQTRDYVLGRIVGELQAYAVGECLAHFGLKP